MNEKIKALEELIDSVSNLFYKFDYEWKEDENGNTKKVYKETKMNEFLYIFIKSIFKDYRE